MGLRVDLFGQGFDILTTTPGSPLEMEEKLVDGRVFRVYKHIPPSLRHFWLAMSDAWADREYIVYEGERVSYRWVAQEASRAASVFRNVYGIRKGDRVGIVCRNYPEWVVVFWACQLLGAISVAINAWLPATGNPPPLQYCITHTECKLLIVDGQRAAALKDWLAQYRHDACGISGILVVRAADAMALGAIPEGMERWEDVVNIYQGPTDEWKKEPACGPEDDSSIFFTSGTTGLPKGVLNTHRMFLTNLPNMMAANLRYMLRRGEPLPNRNQPMPQMSVLVPTPFFHVIATTGHLTFGTAMGSRIVLMRKWNKEVATKLIKQEKIFAVTGVPFMALELGESSLRDSPPKSMQALTFGGSPTPVSTVKHLASKFPNILIAQGYGLTEVNCGASTVCGEDYLSRPTTAGLPCPSLDFLIVDEQTLKVQPPGGVGEIWIRGANVMKGYWKDPQATAKAITKDGWFRTGDIGYLDGEGFLYIKDRLKDIIIRGGENIDSTAVENAIYLDNRVADCAAVAVPDPKLGEQVAVLLAPKPGFKGQIKEHDIVKIARAKKDRKDHLAEGSARRMGQESVMQGDGEIMMSGKAVNVDDANFPRHLRQVMLAARHDLVVLGLRKLAPNTTVPQV
ncbi:hypothetical protein FRB99_008259 [Tulasnella sp. 403]|nr:hypothetical protein FRB99_008259 [Tulasnella sp. 403]